MPARSQHALPVGVDRLQPGDHAFLAFSDDDERWEILGMFTQQGFARDEKVLLLVDDAHSSAEVAARVAGGTAAARRAIRTGQLAVSDTPRFSRDEFDAACLVESARRGADTATGDGYTGLRIANEMPRELSPAEHPGQAVEYETALHESLFAPQDRRITALCHWDEREFGGTPVMDAVRAIHPVTLLDRTGALRATVTDAGVRLTGDSDLSTREEFSAALVTLAGQPQDTLVLDIADLSFLDARSAGALMRLAAGLAPPRRLEVRCRSYHRRMLALFGGRSIPQLSIVTERL
jgi:MEDS: MEthanogen/methylotroph, DcmR Sensory domain